MSRMSCLSEILLVMVWSGILLCILIQFGGDQKQQNTISHQEIVIANAQEVTQIFLNSSSKVYGPQKKQELPNPVVWHDKFSETREKNTQNWISRGGVGIQPPLTDRFPCGAFVSHKYRFIFIKQLMAYSDEFFSDFLGGECPNQPKKQNTNTYQNHYRHLKQQQQSINIDDGNNNIEFYPKQLKKSNINAYQKHQRHLQQQSINIDVNNFDGYSKEHCMHRLVNMNEKDAQKYWKDYFVFTVVRNPWIRALQTYRMLQRTGFLNVTDSECFTPRQNFCAHPHLLVKKCQEKPLCCEQHADNVVISLHRQSNCLRQNSNGQTTVDFVARAENLEEDLNSAIEIINSKYKNSNVPKLPKLREKQFSGKIAEENNFDLGLHKADQCISDLAWHYQDDIDFFGLNDVLKFQQSWKLTPKQDAIVQWISQF